MLITIALALAAPPTIDAGPWQEGRVCVYTPRSKRLEQLPAMTRTLREGDSFSTEAVLIVGGRKARYDPARYREGSNQTWSINREPLAFGGRTYVKYGLPRVLGVNEIEPVGEKDGVVIAAERGNPAREVLYVLHRGLECSFQPYMLQD
jgi:hypothetical protein